MNVTPGEMTYFTWLEGKASTSSNLTRYLATLAEWWNAEFKIPSGAEELGIRKGVCALSNARGGELFVGVADGKELVGCSFTEQTLRQWLQQPRSTPGEWYVVDLNQSVRRIIPVPLGRKDSRIFVLEIVRTGQPAFVLLEGGELAMYIREGESSVKAGSLRALECSRHLSREEILVTLYEELKTLSDVIGGMFPGLAVDLGMSLPYLMKRLEDGSFYRLLTAEDKLIILGKAQGDTGYTGGVLQEVFEARRRYRSELGSTQGIAMGDMPIRLYDTQQRIKGSVGSFAGYLRRQGIKID